MGYFTKASIVGEDRAYSNVFSQEEWETIEQVCQSSQGGRRDFPSGGGVQRLNRTDACLYDPSGATAVVSIDELLGNAQWVP